MITRIELAQISCVSLAGHDVFVRDPTWLLGSYHTQIFRIDTLVTISSPTLQYIVHEHS